MQRVQTGWCYPGVDLLWQALAHVLHTTRRHGGKATWAPTSPAYVLVRASRGREYILPLIHYLFDSDGLVLRSMGEGLMGECATGDDVSRG